MNFFEILVQASRGKSLTRGLINLVIRNFSLILSGTVVDFGSGKGRPSYYKEMSLDRGTKILTVDTILETRPDVWADVTKKLPIEKEQPLQKELESFIACVTNNSEPLVSGPVAREALAVALKIQRQIWLKNRS